MKKLVRKVAVLGASTLMMGATLTSAVALDLAEYPAPYLTNGEFDTSSVIVVGDNAAASDTIGAVDISNNWQVNSYTKGSGTSVTVSGGKTEKVPIEDGGADTSVGDANYLDNEIDDEDIETLADSSVNFQSKEYDYREAVFLYSGGSTIAQIGSPALYTSLTSADDDYGTDVVMEVIKKAIGYYYVFDETINVSKTKSSDALEIDFLGQRIKITGASATQFTAQVGEEHFMNVGDSVVVSGKTVTLNNVGSGGAINVDVDGEIETVSASGTETINGIEINNDETFYDSNDVSARSATLIIGTDAVETYKDGDAYVGEDENNPDWVWDIAGLTNSSATSIATDQATGGVAVITGPGIGILNDFSVNSDDDDNIVGTKDGWASCYSLPNNYVEICLDSLTLDDDDYMNLKIEVVDDLDLDGTGLDRAGDDNAILIESDEPEGLRINNAEFTGGHVKSGSLTSDEKTNKIWLRANNTGDLGLGRGNFTDVFFWHRTNANVSWAGTLNLGNLNAVTDNEFGYVNWGDTKDTAATAQSILLSIATPLKVQARAKLTLDVGTDDTRSPSNTLDDIRVFFLGGNATDYTALGNTSNSEEAGELVWGAEAGIANITTIGTKDEDHKTIYGIIVRNPKSNGASNEVVLDIPNDQLYANIVVKGSATTVGTAGDKITVPIETDTTMLSSEVAGNEANYNLILVGGPCVNPTISAVSGLSGFASCGDWGLKEGEAVIKLVSNGDKVAMLVAGTSALDTRRASKALASKLLDGTEVIVSGTTLTDITVKSAAV